jgi:drug/metabolite transporter (DMT)-like permease
MAVGIAATLQCVAFAINPMGGLERGDGLDPQMGVFVGLLGAIVWSIGSGLLAREVEGDDAADDVDAYRGSSSR